MSTHPPLRTSPISVRIDPAITRVEIDWGVSRLALGDRAPAGRSPLVTLGYRADADSPASWGLYDSESGLGHSVSLPDQLNAAPEFWCIKDRAHVRSPSIYALISIEHAASELLYARTPIFSHLRVSGGRYQPSAVRVSRA